MLQDRLRTSALLIAIVATLLVLDARASADGAEGLWLLPLLIFFALGTAWDAATLLQRSGRAISRPTALIATLATVLGGCVPLLWPLWGARYPVDCPVGRLGWIVIGAVAAMFWILGREMIDYGRPTATGGGTPAAGGASESGAVERTCAATFVSLYVGLPLALLVAVRSLGEGTWGLAALLTLILVTKSCDAGAYFTGRGFGRHKLIPRLSPGKTWEGAIGGVLTSTIVAFVCLTWLFPHLTTVSEPPPWFAALILGPVLAVAGMAGDLAESLVKRECRAKDSGTWLPGLGGVWDVTDSLLAASMPGFVCFAAGLGGN